jgi:Mrp family chromosome partitioning ATPase
VRTLGLTSCSSGEGVSTVAASLAAEAAGIGREPVLLVDANVARPAAHKLLGVKAAPGLAEALRKGQSLPDFLQRCPVPGLSVLAAGQGDADPASVYRAPGLADLVDWLKKEFALVVFDLPAAAPPNPAADRVAGFLDGVVLVVEAERTLVETVRQAKERLEGQTRLLGVVLNKRRQYIPEWLGRFL